MPAETPAAASLTPCVGVCRLGADGLCVGCRRTPDEIARWRELGDAERLRLIRDVLPLRQERR